VAILIIALVVFFYLFMTNLKRTKAQR
jgi:hypothetical protein